MLFRGEYFMPRPMSGYKKQGKDESKVDVYKKRAKEKYKSSTFRKPIDDSIAKVLNKKKK